MSAGIQLGGRWGAELMDCSVFVPAVTSRNNINQTSAEDFPSKRSQFCYNLTNKLLKNQPKNKHMK